MKVLKFILITDEEEVINIEANYYIKDETLKFKDQDTLYEFSIKDKIFTKIDKESKIIIDFNKDKITIILLENNYAFDMEIDDIEVKIDENNIYLKYSFMGTEKTTNCILIKY